MPSKLWSIIPLCMIIPVIILDIAKAVILDKMSQYSTAVTIITSLGIVWDGLTMIPMIITLTKYRHMQLDHPIIRKDNIICIIMLCISTIVYGLIFAVSMMIPCILGLCGIITIPLGVMFVYFAVMTAFYIKCSLDIFAYVKTSKKYITLETHELN